MSTIELEAQKASLTREILNINDENILDHIRFFLKKPVVFQYQIPEKRPLGILNGKARIVFHDDFEMTTEELLGLQ